MELGNRALVQGQVVTVDVRDDLAGPAIFDAQGVVVGWAAVTVAAADGASPSGTLPQTGAGVGPLWIVVSLLLVTAGGALLAVRRRATRHQLEQ